MDEPPAEESIAKASVVPIRLIKQTEYRGYTIKVVARGTQLRLLIYPLGEFLATHSVVSSSGDVEEGFAKARTYIDLQR